MRVSLVSEHASPLAVLGGVDAGGQNVHVAALARGLAATGDQVTVHTRRDDPSLARRVGLVPGVVVDHVDAGPPRPLPKDALARWMDAFADELVDRWRTERPDVVHAHFWMSGLAALCAGQQLGIPVVLTYHALGSEKRRHQGSADTSPSHRITAEAMLAGSVDRVIATTARERRTVLAMGADPADVTVIPCGVDLRTFTDRGPTAPPRLRDRRRIVCVSRLVPRKGIAEVVAALARVPDAELLVAGGPPEALLSTDPDAESLRRAARRSGVADRVRLLGSLTPGAVAALLRSADVACCCPWYEPFGLVAVEAMACGVPVLATGVGGLAETILDGRTGVLVPPREPEAIADALRSLLSDDVTRTAMGAAATQRAAAYDWGHIAACTRSVYENLAEERRGRSATSSRRSAGSELAGRSA